MNPLTENDELKSVIRRFLESCPSDFDFPLGGAVEIPLKTEQDLVTVIHNVGVLGSGDLVALRKDLSIRQAYSLLIFAVRMAVLAARTRSARLITAGLLGIMIDDGAIDWRDLIVALAIIEDCASRLQVDFQTEVEKWVSLATDVRRKTIRESYLSRTAEMRKVELMGYLAAEGSEGLTYVHKYEGSPINKPQ